MNARILVMAKTPIPGTVKTRLRLDPEDAARLQAALILDTVEKTRALGQTIVAGAPRDRLDRISRLLPGDVRLIPQPEGDLGERMLAATTTLFDEAPDPVLILGTDASTLPRKPSSDPPKPSSPRFIYNTWRRWRLRPAGAPGGAQGRLLGDRVVYGGGSFADAGEGL